MFVLKPLWNMILNWIYELFYYIGIFFCRILNVLYSIFKVLAGTQTVTYHGQQKYLISIFFSDTTITTVYGGMALIGLIMLVIFTIFAILKKMTDLGDKMQASIGEILRKMLTSFLFIISMNFIMIATINITNVLMQSIEYLFDNAASISESNTITFTTTQYAAMARIFNTIGNYSLSDSSSSRYNLNTCYNEIRPDMEYLEREKVFNYSYDVVVDGESQESWQSVLSQIARAHDLATEQPVDEYDASLSAAMLDAMNYVKVNRNNMTVLTSYSRENVSARSTTGVSIEVLLWLCATTNAAKNGAYNGTNVSFGDPVRSPYLTGERSIYSLSQVEHDFSLSFSNFNHLVVIIGGFMMCAEFLMLCINCVARIFNMILLYIVAPPFIATAPFDDGAKFKQWSTAFVIQSFNVFGSIISIRLLMLFVPIIFDSNLVFLGGGFVNMMAKTLIVIGAAYTARKASGLLSGILSENAGYQSLLAGNVGDDVRRGGFGRMYDTAAGMLKSSAKWAGDEAGSLGWKGIKKVAGAPRSSYRSARRLSLKSDIAQGGAEGQKAARNFLDMDKGYAQKHYNMSDKQYTAMRNLAHDTLDRGREEGGRNADIGSVNGAAGSNVQQSANTKEQMTGTSNIRNLGGSGDIKSSSGSKNSSESANSSESKTGMNIDRKSASAPNSSHGANTNISNLNSSAKNSASGMRSGAGSAASSSGGRRSYDDSGLYSNSSANNSSRADNSSRSYRDNSQIGSEVHDRMLREAGLDGGDGNERGGAGREVQKLNIPGNTEETRNMNGGISSGSSNVSNMSGAGNNTSINNLGGSGSGGSSNVNSMSGGSSNVNSMSGSSSNVNNMSGSNANMNNLSGTGTSVNNYDGSSTSISNNSGGSAAADKSRKNSRASKTAPVRFSNGIPQKKETGDNLRNLNSDKNKK